MKNTIFAVLAAILAAQPLYAKGAPKTEEQKTIYAIGAGLAIDLVITKKELPFLLKGIEDGANGSKLDVDPESRQGKIKQLMIDRKSARSRSWLDRAAKKKGAKRFPSGLIYRELKAGSGPKPSATNTVKVHYKGTFPDGKEFDSSYKRNAPATFPLNGVIKCWTEGVAKMSVGAKAELICPYQIAYGERGRPGAIPPRSTLVFQVELLEIVR